MQDPRTLVSMGPTESAGSMGRPEVKVMETPGSGVGHGGPSLMANPVSSTTVVWRPRRGGPVPYLRLDLAIKVDEGLRVVELVLGQGCSFREAAVALDMNLTTAWRRYHFVMDWLLPERWGVRSRRLPPQRGTRACPRGRPWIAELDDVGGPLYREGN